MFEIRDLMRCLLRTGLFAVVLMAVNFASAKPPVRNMTVELRIVAPADLQAASPGAYVVRTQTATEPGLEIQKIFVLNGERGQMKLSGSVPVQWVKTAVSSTAADGSTGKGGETPITWMEAGQALSVLVNWPGGKLPAKLEIEVDTAAMAVRMGDNLPSQMKNRFATTVSTPLGEWATVAVTGKRLAPETAGVYSTAPLEADQGKLVQVRVLAP
jgi:hypothetical protein